MDDDDIRLYIKMSTLKRIGFYFAETQFLERQ